MSDQQNQTQALRGRVEEKHGPLREQEVPDNPDGLVELAKSDPDRFNALYEGGCIPREALAPRKEDD